MRLGKKIYTILIAYSLANLFFCTNVFAIGITITKVVISPLNRAIFYFNEVPEKYDTKLSAEKTKISLKLSNTSALEPTRTTDGEGIIKNIHIQTIINDLEISVILRGKRGFNTVVLPFTKSLMLEVFDWSNLSPEEDNYRSGLLAFEEKIYQSALNYFKKAESVPNANFFSGLIYLIMNKNDLALISLKKAENENANIDDLFAALYQVYSSLRDSRNANKYKKIFLKKTGFSSIPLLSEQNVDISDTLKEESLSLLYEANNINDTLNSDTLNSQTSDSTIYDAKVKKDTVVKSEDNSFVTPPWYYFGIAFLVISLIILIKSYMKWRKQQVQNLKKSKTNKFNSDLSNAKNAIKKNPQAAKAYKNSGSILDKTIGQQNKENVKLSQTEEKNTTTSSKMKNDSSKMLEQIAQDVINSKKLDSSPKLEITASKGIDPKMELALRLQKAHQKLKEKNLSNINGKEISDNEDKLNEVAKKLGVEKGSLETKKSLSELERNKNSLSKLAKKFDVNENKDE